MIHQERPHQRLLIMLLHAAERRKAYFRAEWLVGVQVQALTKANEPLVAGVYTMTAHQCSTSGNGPHTSVNVTCRQAEAPISRHAHAMCQQQALAGGPKRDALPCAVLSLASQAEGDGVKARDCAVQACT